MMNLKKFEELTQAKEIYDMACADLAAINAYQPVAQREFKIVLGHQSSVNVQVIGKQLKEKQTFRFESSVMAVDEQDELKAALVAIFSKRVAKAIKLLKSLGVDVEETA